MDLDRAWKELTTAVRKDLGDDELRDVAEHGADGGVPGFTYYTETGAFYDVHEEAIWTVLEDLAEEMGEKPLEVIAGLSTDVTDIDTFKNVLAWFALEEVARRETGEDEDDDDG